MRSLPLLLLVLLAFPALARAEPRNPYGLKGRTVLIAGLDGLVHGSGYTQSHAAWGVHARMTFVRFVRDNFAIGGTVALGLSSSRDAGYRAEWTRRVVGADLDLIGHVPMARRVSMRFWGWLGISQRITASKWPAQSGYGTERDTEVLRYMAIGFSPNLLIHCSSSVALGIGPSLTVFLPISDDAELGLSLGMGPSVTYSFGAPPQDEATQQPVVPRFARRGRNVLTGGFSVGASAGGSLGYARFVTDHFAIGPTLFAGTQLFEVGPREPLYAGTGVQMIAEVPLRGRWSMLLRSTLAYRFDRINSIAEGFEDYYFKYENRRIDTHQVEVSASVYPVFHLFEALVLGVGPTVTEHVRIASSVDGLDTAYLSLGVDSVLAGSF